MHAFERAQSRRSRQATPAPSEGPAPPAEAILALQRSAGNHAVATLASRFFYHAVGPRELGEGFPRPMGVTDAWSPQRLELQATEAGGTFELVLVHDDYNPARHPSKGIAAGTYHIGMANRRGDNWTGHIEKYVKAGKPVTWPSGQPAPGTYPLMLDVTGQDASRVRQFEDEHVRDFTHAWKLSVGVLSQVIDTLEPAAGIEAALDALTSALLARNAGYLVPAQPRRLDAWGTRLGLVYRQLCDQSSTKRDTPGEHSPVGYKFTPDADGLHVRFETGPFHPEPKPDAAAINPVFPAALPPPPPPADPAQVADLQVGQEVRWAPDPSITWEEAPVGPTYDEWEVLNAPGGTLVPSATAGAVRALLGYGSAKVHSIVGDKIWIHLTQLPPVEQDQPEQGEHSEDEDEAEEPLAGYVFMRRSLVKPAS